jgi:ABC-type transport system involved in multi-copper enzyme maturation permease subunit
MKYLAILRDSLREAIDTKVFYVMMTLSGILVLLAASLSFRQLTVEDDLAQLTGTVNWAVGLSPQSGLPRLSYEDFRQTNDAAEPWKGDYAFTFVMEFPDEARAKQVRGGFLHSQLQDLKRDLLQRPLDYLDDLKVTEVPSSDPKQIRFAVTSHGTSIDNFRAWKYEPSLFFGGLPMSIFRAPLGGIVYLIEDYLVNGVGAWIAILVGIVITAFFIPNMLRKGTLDLLLVKPMYRSTLLIFKYIGGLSFMFLNTAFAVGGIWLVLGLRSGIWATGFLLTILVITFCFAVLYSVSALMGVLTRSPIVSILVTVFVWAMLFVLGVFHSYLDATKKPSEVMAKLHLQESADRADKDAPPPPAFVKPYPDWVYATVDMLHYVLPRTRDLTNLNSHLIIKGVLLDDNPRLKELEKEPPFTWAESLTVSGIFTAVMLGLACWRFGTRDY